MWGFRRQDRSTKKGRRAVAKGQVGFLKFIVKPLFEVGASQLPFFKQVACPNLEANLTYWTEQEQSNAESAEDA